MPRLPRALIACWRLAFILIGVTCVRLLAADAPATGSIQGRVVNAENGQYLSKAVVSVQGTTLQTLTDNFGNYTLADVPAGTATLRVSYTGQSPLTANVAVTAGQTANEDFMFNRQAAVETRGEGKVLKLDEFVVQTQRFKNAQEIAINEERNSVTLKNVVAADAFGTVTKGNIGEFVKFLPGVQVQYGGTYVNPSDVSYISVRGFGPDNTAIMMDGAPISNPSPASLARAVGVDMLTINNASRVEVIKVPTPDMPTNSPGGAINLITKSAFEYARPELDVDVHMNFNTMDTNTPFKRQPGPSDRLTYHTLPSAYLTYILPVNKNLGVTVTGSTEYNYTVGAQYQPKWQMTPVSYDLTSIGGASGPVTNSTGNISDAAHPWLNTISVTDNPWSTRSRSIGTRVDWKPTPNQLIQASVSGSDYKGIEVSRKLGYTIKTAQDWGSDFVTSVNYPAVTKLKSDPGSTTNMQVISRDKLGNSIQSYLKYAVNYGLWHFDARASWGQGYGTYQDMKNGHFSEVDMKISAGQILFKGINDGMPNSITVYDRNGALINTTQLANWKYDSFKAQSGITYSRDTESSYNANLSRDLNFSRFSLQLKTGVDREISKQEKWGRGTGYGMAYVGPTLGNVDFLDPTYVRSPGFGWAAQQWADVYKVYDLYTQHPEYFDPNDPSVSPGNWQSWVNQQKSVTETKDAVYGMGDARFFHNRLAIVFGARKQSTKDEGRQPFNDGSWNFLKYANGSRYVDPVLGTTVRIDQANSNLYTDSSKSTAAALQGRVKAAGISFPSAPVTDKLAQYMLQYQPNHAIHVRSSNPAAPLIAASYNITPNLVFKPSWSRTTSLPNYETTGADGSTTGGLISTQFKITGADPVDESKLGGEGGITVANASLKPQTTDSYEGTLDYYTQNGGKLEATYYYKKTKDAWVTDTIYNTDPNYATALSALGLDPADYPNWALSTTFNSDNSLLTRGTEFTITQNLGLLGAWGQHIDMFGNYSHKLTGQSSNSKVIGFASSSNDTYAGGIRIGIRRLSLMGRVTRVNQVLSKNGTIAYPSGSTSIYQMYNYVPSILKLDVSANYLLTKRFTLYVASSNILNSTTDQYTHDGSQIVPSYAYRTKLSKYGVIVTAGVSARF